MGFPLSTAPRYDGFTHKTRPKRPGAQPDPRLAAMGRVLAAQGLGEDDLLAHINRREARLLARLGGSGTRNARTGLLQFDDTDDAETPEEDGTPAPLAPPETPQPIPDDQLQAQADATLRQIGPIPTSEPGPVGWREQAQGIRRGVENYVTRSAENLARIPRGIGGVIKDFQSDPPKALESLGPTLDGIEPGLGSLPRAAAAATRTLRLIGRVPAEALKESAGLANRAAEPADAPQIGPFGPILTQHQGDWRNAALALERMESGEAVGALSHPDIEGPISLVWGKEGTQNSDGYGLSKLIAWHPEVLDDLQGRVNAMRVVSRTPNRYQLESPTGQATVRLDWDGRLGNWLLTTYDTTAPHRTEKFTGSLSDLWRDQPLPPLR